MRTAEQVLEDHLERRAMGDVEGDIRHNYAEDVVLMTSAGLYQGHDGVRDAAEELNDHLGDGTYVYTNKLVENGHAFAEWRVEGVDTQIRDGADTFMVVDGKITLQAIHYALTEE